MIINTDNNLNKNYYKLYCVTYFLGKKLVGRKKRVTH